MRPWPAEAKQKALNLYLQGLTCDEIEDETGISSSSVSEWVKAAGLARPGGPRPIPIKAEHKTIIKSMYVDCKLSAEKVAKRLPYTTYRIKRHLRESGLMRSRSEAQSTHQSIEPVIGELKTKQQLDVGYIEKIMGLCDLNWMDMVSAIDTTWPTLANKKATGSLPDSWQQTIKDVLIDQLQQTSFGQIKGRL